MKYVGPSIAEEEVFVMFKQNNYNKNQSSRITVKLKRREEKRLKQKKKIITSKNNFLAHHDFIFILGVR